MNVFLYLLNQETERKKERKKGRDGKLLKRHLGHVSGDLMTRHLVIMNGALPDPEPDPDPDPERRTGRERERERETHTHTKR